MDRSHIKDFDNPFPTPKQHSAGMISVNVPTNKCLCKKLDRLNLTLLEGYPFKSSEAGGLQHDQFIKTPTSQSKWYVLHSDKQASSRSVSYWYKSACLNSSYDWIARFAGLLVHSTNIQPHLPGNPRKSKIIQLHL